MLFVVRNSLLRLTFLLAVERGGARSGLRACHPARDSCAHNNSKRSKRLRPPNPAPHLAAGKEQRRVPRRLQRSSRRNQQAPQNTAPPAPASPRRRIQDRLSWIDPAHGGTDSGARGGTGVLEKDVVLAFAKTLRAEIERQGYRAVLTRSDDSNPSYDDRAAMANGYRDVIFISLHIASTGAAGTARAYYYPLPGSGGRDRVNGFRCTIASRSRARLTFVGRGAAIIRGIESPVRRRRADSVRAEFLRIARRGKSCRRGRPAPCSRARRGSGGIQRVG